jgi:multidrug efflux pump subunit AcrB
MTSWAKVSHGIPVCPSYWGAKFFASSGSLSDYGNRDDFVKKLGETIPERSSALFMLFNDEFGDTFGTIYGFTADGFTHRERRDYVERIRARLPRVADVSKVEIIGAQDEKIMIEFSTEKLGGLGIDRAALIAALQAQNAVSPAGALQTGEEKLALRVSGAFETEQDIWPSTSVRTVG